MAWSDTKKAKKRRQKKMLKAIFGKSLPIVMAVVVIIGILFGYLYENVEPVRLFVDDIVVIFNPDAVRPFIDPEGDEMAVHFIDVGQGDSALLQTPKGSVLIDCGEKEYGDDVVLFSFAFITKFLTLTFLSTYSAEPMWSESGCVTMKYSSSVTPQDLR